MRLFWVLFTLAGCSPCESGGECSVEDGDYHVMSPSGWDRVEPLPVVLHAHGVHQRPSRYLNDADLQKMVDDMMVLMVVPEGIDERWSIDHMGLEGNGRRELLFIDQVIDDVQTRFPVQSDRIYASGFSLGASLVYTLACERGDVFAAATPISGGFWEPLPERCPAPAMPLCHIHGLEDETWPVEGRFVTEGNEEGQQASVEDDVQFWVTHNQCSPITETRSSGELTCTVWRGCAAREDVEVEYCTHPGGHQLTDEWLIREVEWLLQYRRP
ncbi:MAG: PHB depolymerase family esterase [Myxococcota bacterium]